VLPALLFKRIGIDSMSLSCREENVRRSLLSIDFFLFLASNLMPDLLSSATLFPDAVYGSTRKTHKDRSLPSSPSAESQEQNSKGNRNESET
jgi:hypothetical protein